MTPNSPAKKSTAKVERGRFFTRDILGLLSRCAPESARGGSPWASWESRHFGCHGIQSQRALKDNPTVRVDAGAELVGREEACAVLQRFVQALVDGPCAAVISGEAGIGKTTLWKFSIDAAQQAGLTVLSARCVEAELPLPFVGLSDLLHEAYSATADGLREHHRRALAVALGAVAPSDPAPDPLLLARAFLAVLHAAAAETPVLVAVDDVQWLDASSLRILAFAARRLGDLPVGVLATLRGDGPDLLGLSEAFETDRFDHLHLHGLSAGALVHLVRERLDVRIPRPLLSRVHAASGGNPLFALEFARQLGRVDGSRLRPLPLPESLEELFRTRLAGFSPRVRELLAFAAAADNPTPALLHALDDAGKQIDLAVDAGAVVIDDGIVRFTHPLLASAVYSQLAPSERRALHRRLAELVGEDGERARHLALSSLEPDAGVAALLDDAAAHAHARGAPEAAAELAQEAVRLTPSSDAPVAGDRGVAVAAYLADAGRMAEAARWLERVLEAEREGPRRARALLLKVSLEHDLETVLLSLCEALEHIGADPTLRTRALLYTSTAELYRGDVAASEEAARRALEVAEKTDDAELLAHALAILADRAHRSGRPEPELLQRALTLAETLKTPPQFPTVRCAAAEQLLLKGDLGGARDVLEAELGIATHSGVEPARARILSNLADLEIQAGNWQRAAEYLDDAWEIAGDGGDLWGESDLCLRKAELAALRGEVATVRSLTADLIGRAEQMHRPLLGATARWVVGFLELSLGQPANAWAALSDVVRTPAGAGKEIGRAVADAVETLVAIDRTEDAVNLLPVLQAEAQNGDLWAAPAVLRCQALILLGRREVSEAATTANAAAAAFQDGGFPFDRGRALLVAGQALRRQGQRRHAGEHLDLANSVFEELGASLWSAEVHKELRRARPRSRRDRELTHAERRVATLVAKGRTNREVAAELFTTVATVEAHLTRIYRKLGLRSRTELARQHAEGTLSLTDE